MTATPTATFVVEPKGAQGYRITAEDGPSAARLRRLAVAVIDMLGQPSPKGPPRVHAWLGPVGPQGEFVRVVIDRLPSGEFRYRQAWFADKALPAHPAHCGFADLADPADWPADVSRVLGYARRAAESGATEWVSVATSCDALAYCRALTEVLGTPPGNRLTWVTHAPGLAVPVHLQFRTDAALSEVPSVGRLPGGEMRLRNVAPLPTKAGGRATARPPRSGRWGMTLVALVVVFVGGAAAGWFGRENVTKGSLELFGSSVDVLPGLTPRPNPPPDPRLESVKGSLGRTRDTRENLRKFLAQDGLAAPTGAEPVSEKFTVNLQDPELERKPAKLKNTEVRQLLELLQALDDWEKTPPAP